VSGIVRVQSFETFQNISSGDALGRQIDNESKRGGQSSSSGSGSGSGKRAQVTGSVVESRAKVSSATSSSQKWGQELEKERESLGSPAVRRDKAVSFEQSSSSPSPSALPVCKSLAAQSQRQHSPDIRLELGESADGKVFPTLPIFTSSHSAQYLSTITRTLHAVSVLTIYLPQPLVLPRVLCCPSSPAATCPRPGTYAAPSHQTIISYKFLEVAVMCSCFFIVCAHAVLSMVAIYVSWP
jgi:hypothetical protein